MGLFAFTHSKLRYPLETAYDGRETVYAVWKSSDRNYYYATLDVAA